MLVTSSKNNSLSGHKVYFILAFTFYVVGIVIKYFYSKEAIHLAFNEWHTSFGDLFFRWWTYAGDGITLAIFAVLLLLFHSYYATIRVAITFIGTSIITQTLKRQVFPDHLRPSRALEDLAQQLNYVEGVDVHCCNSFPSGHTMAAFALFTSIVLLQKNQNLDIICFVAALIIGMSRIYLQQHFFEDILFGSFLGITWTALVFTLFDLSPLRNKNSWQKSLLR